MIRARRRPVAPPPQQASLAMQSPAWAAECALQHELWRLRCIDPAAGVTSTEERRERCRRVICEGNLHAATMPRGCGVLSGKTFRAVFTEAFGEDLQPTQEKRA